MLLIFVRREAGNPWIPDLKADLPDILHLARFCPANGRLRACGVTKPGPSIQCWRLLPTASFHRPELGRWRAFLFWPLWSAWNARLGAPSLTRRTCAGHSALISLRAAAIQFGS